jgi:hypothetical protein
MPLRQMSEVQATDRVIEHLLNRARSRKSRLKNNDSSKEQWPVRRDSNMTLAS